MVPAYLRHVLRVGQIMDMGNHPHGPGQAGNISIAGLAINVDVPIASLGLGRHREGIGNPMDIFAPLFTASSQ